jgi:hypothetical protein
VAGTRRDAARIGPRLGIEVQAVDPGAAEDEAQEKASGKKKGK